MPGFVMTWLSWRKYRMKTKTAFLISEVCAPWVTNLWFFLVLGVTSHAWPAAITAILGTSIMPMAAIRVLDTNRKSRRAPRSETRTKIHSFCSDFCAVGCSTRGIMASSYAKSYMGLCAISCHVHCNLRRSNSVVVQSINPYWFMGMRDHFF